MITPIAELYERAGADPAPQTWSKLLENCEKLKHLGVDPFTADGIHWYTSWWFDHLAQRIAGAEKTRAAFLDPARGTPWTDDDFLRAARLIGEMLDAGYFAPNISGLNDLESEMLFWREKAAGVFVGSWFTNGRQLVQGREFTMRAYRFPAVEGGKGNPRDLIGTVNTLSIPAKSRRPELGIEYLRLIDSRWFQELQALQGLLISPLLDMPTPAVQQGLDVIIRETENFYPFSFGLEGRHPFLYRQYWDEWNRFMVARELTAPQFVENLEKIFASYYRTAVARGASA